MFSYYNAYVVAICRIIDCHNNINDIEIYRNLTATPWLIKQLADQKAFENRNFKAISMLKSECIILLSYYIQLYKYMGGQ